MLKSLVVAAIIGFVSAENLITISVKPEVAKYMEGKQNLLGAQVNAWFNSPEFKKF